MLTASTTLVDAIESQGQAPAYSITTDFDRSGSPDDISTYGQSTTITRMLTTDTPDGTRLVAGYSTAEVEINLGGDKTNNDHDAAWTWSPMNTDSPFYGKKRTGAPHVVELGYDTGTIDDPNPELLTRFTGNVRLIDTDGQARTADLDALDPSDRLRVQVRLPMFTKLGHPGLSGRTYIDYILTQNGYVLADCDLEDSLNPMTATPWTSDKQDAWTLIQQIAAAEYACAFFDETGTFHFWNRQHFTLQSVDYDAMTVTTPSGITSPIPTVTTVQAVKGLITNEGIDGVRNHIVVPFAPLQVQPADWIWQTTAPRGIHSKDTISINATFDNPVQSLATDVIVIPIGGDTGGKSGYRANAKEDGTGRAVENLEFTITPHAASARIDITNPNPFPVYLVEPRNNLAGHLYPGWSADEPRPMLWLWGRRVVSDPDYTSITDGSMGAVEEASDADSMDPDTGYGEQLFTVDNTAGFIQDPATARTLGYDLLRLLKRPTPYIGSVDVVADPRLQLGDRIQLQDNTGMMIDEHAWIVGITEVFSASNGYTQTLTLRLCAAIGGWILGHPTRSVLGSTTVLGGVY